MGEEDELRQSVSFSSSQARAPFQIPAQRILRVELLSLSWKVQLILLGRITNGKKSLVLSPKYQCCNTQTCFSLETGVCSVCHEQEEMKPAPLETQQNALCTSFFELEEEFSLKPRLVRAETSLEQMLQLGKWQPLWFEFYKPLENRKPEQPSSSAVLFMEFFSDVSSSCACRRSKVSRSRRCNLLSLSLQFQE